MTLQVTPKHLYWHDLEIMSWKGLGALTGGNAPCRRAVDAERCSDCSRASARVAQRLDVSSRVDQRCEVAGLVPAQIAASGPGAPTGPCAPAHIPSTGEYSCAWHDVQV